MAKHTILFLAANPSGSTQLALDREARAIHVELERAGFRDEFDFQTRWAAEPLDLLRELRKLKPTVVHFSGHGEKPHGEKPHGASPANGTDRSPLQPTRRFMDRDPPATDEVVDATNTAPGGLYFQSVD